MEKAMENREFYIDSDGIRLHAKLDFPQKQQEKYPLAVIVHGFTGHMEEDHIRLLAEALCDHNFAALRVELYGHGGSGGRFEDHTMLKWLSEILDVIDYAKALPFAGGLYLLGHSAGGLATVLAGGIRHNALRAIVPMSPAINIRDGALTGDMLGASFDPADIPDEIFFPADDDVAAGLMLRGNYVRVAQFLPVEAAAAAFCGPVLIIHADTDETVPVQCAIDLAGHYADARLVITKDDTHCYDNHLDVTIREIVQFLEAVRDDAVCG